MGIELMFVFLLGILLSISLEVNVRREQKILKIRKEIDELSTNIQPVDKVTYDLIISNISNMILIYSRALFDNKVVDKYNEQHIYDITLDKDEMVELKTRIRIAVMRDISPKMYSYIEYYTGSEYIIQYIDFLIIGEIMKLSDEKNKDNIKNMRL